MDSIRQWAFGVCAAAIACSLAQMLLPKSGMQRVFGITTSVFFLACLLSPVAIGGADFRLFSEHEIQQMIDERSALLDTRVRGQATALAAENIRITAQQILSEMGIETQKIYINIHEDGENGISISECEVELEERYFPRHEEIRKTLMERLGVNVLIGYK